MFIITIKGEAKTDYPNLEELDGINCQDNFAEYFDNTSYSPHIKSGYMCFKYENGKLFTYTSYTSDRELTSDELTDLEDYTTGQWSDGIGEGFEQEPCMEGDHGEAYISPWYWEQETTITQTEQ